MTRAPGSGDPPGFLARGRDDAVAAPEAPEVHEPPADDWWTPVVEQFHRRFGRGPRILHLSNIANNAYNNAKLLIDAGFECDVICADYYHIMGCPEWEDADFLGDIRDHFAPDWTEVDIQGFERPRWFAQGPASICIKYLHAMRTGKSYRSAHYWRLLSVANRTVPTTSWERAAFETLRNTVAATEIRLRRIQGYFIAALSPDRVGEKVERTLRGWSSAELAQSAWYGVLEAGCVTSARTVSRLMLFTTYALAFLRPTGVREADRPNARLLEKVRGDFERTFADRMDKISRDDLVAFCWWLEDWSRLFKAYDVIVGYGIDPILPYLAGVPYFALEHGTLRDIPWKNDAQGRLTALSYSRASHIFVTNLDCMESARSLGGDRVSFINHPYDELHGEARSESEALRKELSSRLDANFLIFFPTRHDWIENKGFADKANDVLLRAFARLRRNEMRVGMICCQWGHNVDESQALIRELGCADHVVWQEPMGMVRFERTALSCDVVADQFKLGAFGGIVFKALAVGAPVCTFLDEDSVQGTFSSVPPVINCRTEDEIVDRLADVFMAPERLGELSRASMDWVRREHSGRDTVETQLRQFVPVLEQRLQA